MKYRLFCSDCDEAKAIIRECREKVAERDRLIDELLEKYDAVGFVPHPFEGQPREIIMGKGDYSDWLRWEKYCDLGEKRFNAYSPRRTTKKGRELYEDMQDPRLGFAPSDFIVRSCNAELHVASSEPERMLYSSIGWMDSDTLYLRIPDCSYFPAIPGWFEEILE